MNILVFGQLVEATGSKNIEAPCAKSVGDLRKLLQELFPNLGSKTFAIAVNNEIRQDDFVLQEVDQIALLPPFSGG